MLAHLLALLTLPAAALAQQRVIVTYADALLSINDTQTIATLPAPAPPAGIRLVYDLPRLSIKVFELTDPGLDINQACGDLEDSDPSIGSCEGDATVSIDQGTAAPDDKLYPQQYVYQAANAVGAWQQGHFGDASIRVCITDTGVQTDHPDLAPSLWTDPSDGSTGVAFLQGAQSGKVEDQSGHGQVFQHCTLACCCRIKAELGSERGCVLHAGPGWLGP